ncbi:hypothetical protein HYN69_03640 [Gemmobacter aquarius]|uniref:Uncharacterized protein n=2 Tax=Paragemmobacter aquarius TaxID=2169400 RepID=A0A2S0UIS6_9RHOB|nr:hypothetical protein HYN69_03640 [Gemmobacter aquarius]
MSGHGFRSMRPDHDGKNPDPRTVEAITKAKRGELLPESEIPADFFALRLLPQPPPRPALKAAMLAKHWRLFRCPVVDVL